MTLDFSHYLRYNIGMIITFALYVTTTFTGISREEILIGSYDSVEICQAESHRQIEQFKAQFPKSHVSVDCRRRYDRR